MRLESQLERAFVAYITKTGGEVRKVKWIGRNGAPDRVVLYPDGEQCWVELKTKAGPLRPGQLREHARLRDMGQVVHVVRSKDEYVQLFPAS